MRNIIKLILVLGVISLNAQTKKLKVEPNHSTVGFNISIAGFTKVTGKFTDFDILLDWNEIRLDSCKISANIKVNSINTGIKDRDTHLRSSDFFDIEKFPEIRFQSDSIKKVDFSNYTAHGKLTMHGITKEFILPFQIVKIENNTIGITSKTTLSRKDYGVGSSFKHNSMPNFLADIINIEIDFWTKKRKE